jgi:hypothetical protein
MTTILQPRAPVAAPVHQAPPGSILDCATVIDVDSLWDVSAAQLWASAGCGTSTIIANPLCTDPGYAAPSKTFAPPAWNVPHNFAVYRALSCKTIGFDLTTADLEAAFAAAEGRAVGKALSNIYEPSAHAVTGTGGAMCAFGALADYALDNYGGAPTFLLPTTVAVALQAGQVLQPKPGGGYQSALGGCIAIGAGLPSALAFGSIVIQRSALVSVEVVNPTTNDLQYLCERVYLVGVDCDFVAKVSGITANCAAMP